LLQKARSQVAEPPLSALSIFGARDDISNPSHLESSTCRSQARKTRGADKAPGTAVAVQYAYSFSEFAASPLMLYLPENPIADHHFLSPYHYHREYEPFLLSLEG
jgi:hypothetical protein